MRQLTQATGGPAAGLSASPPRDAGIRRPCIPRRGDNNTTSMKASTLPEQVRLRIQCAAVAAAAMVTATTGCGGVQWQSRVEPAMQRAAALNQLILVQFRTMTDPVSIDADTTLFVSNNVLKVLKDFQCVRIDALLNKELAERWGVSVVPTYLVLRPDGTLIDRRTGQLGPDDFRAFLNWASLRR